MHRLRIALCFIVLPLWFSTARAGDDAIGEAHKLLLRGKYAEAAELYKHLLQHRPPSSPAPLPQAGEGSLSATVGLARCLTARGKDDEAQKALLAAPGKNADVSAELAALAFGRGAVDEARKRAEEAVKLDRDQLHARWLLAELARTSGRLDEADRGYQWLVRYYNDHDVKQAESLRWIGLAAAQSARWHRQADQFHFLVNDLYPDALQQDADYWPAHYEAGVLFLEKHNQADATKEFQAALEINPNAAEVHAAVASLAMEQRDGEKAQASLARALEINPRLLDAWLLKADLLWANFQVSESLQLLREKVLPLNPLCEETLGRMGACYLLLDPPPKSGKESRLGRLTAEVTRRNPHAGEFYLALASALEERHKLKAAETYLREAIHVMPRQVGPQSELGLLYMRDGREDDARRVLRAAFEADPFNVRVKNSLEVLDVLDSMQTLDGGRSAAGETPTPQFAIIYNGQYDKLLARYAVRHLKKVYPMLCRRFGYEPPEKTLVEIFNQAEGLDGHQWFSARMIGLPYLDTVAASTGRIVAMASPNEPQSSGAMNWARVLTHEMVHVITLQQTNFNCPHWFTEGLAVWSENCPRPQQWNELLVERFAQGKLFNLDTLNLGFIRPQSGGDWLLAYCQAKLYVEYMLVVQPSRLHKKAGETPAPQQEAGQTPAPQEESLRQMLAAYTEGLDTPAAIQRVFGVSQQEFERGYTAFLKKEVARLTVLKWPAEAGFERFRQSAEQRPHDAEAAAALAYAYLGRGADKEALEAARSALKLRPKYPLATYVVACLRLKEEKTDEAVALLESGLDPEFPQPNVLELLAGLKLKAKKYDEAAKLYALGERLDPFDVRWTEGLVKVYLATGDKPSAIKALARLARADVDDLATRKKLVQMSLDRKDYAAAETWGREGIEINVMDADLHGAVAESLAARRNYSEAVAEFETVMELKPDDPQPQYALAKVLVKAREPAKAREVLKKLLKQTPDYPGADSLLKSIK